MIEKLFKEHNDRGFPEKYRGEEILGVDLVMLDADTVGCIDAFLARRQNRDTLDSWRIAILGLCYRDISLVVSELHGEAKKYFRELETMARLTLEEIRNTEKGA